MAGGVERSAGDEEQPLPGDPTPQRLVDAVEDLGHRAHTLVQQNARRFY
jgi:hypothetical protein